jgi:glycosyltransferase involved in cell wall biosynthesis
LSKSFSKKFSKESSFFLAMLDKIQLLASKYSDCIITVSIAFKRELLRIGISEKKIHILANSPDDTFFKPELEHTTKQDIGFENRFIVLYQGSVSKERGIDRLIDAVNLLKVKIPNILGLIAGGGGQITELQCMIENLGLEKYIHLTGRLSPNEIPKFVACADVCTLMALDIPVYRLYSPDKLFEYMTYKKIILAPKLDGIIDITGIDGCYYYKAGDADDMAKQIYKIYQENNHTEHIRRSQEIFQNYKWETAKLEMLKCYNKLKK